jgi:hypothetical protein
VSDGAVIGPGAVEQASKDVMGVAEDLGKRTASLTSSTSGMLREAEPREFACRLALNDAIAFWERRVADCRALLEDTAEFMAARTRGAAAGPVEPESGTRLSIGGRSTEERRSRAGRSDETGTGCPTPAGGVDVPVP